MQTPLREGGPARRWKVQGAGSSFDDAPGGIMSAPSGSDGPSATVAEPTASEGGGSASAEGGSSDGSAAGGTSDTSALAFMTVVLGFGLCRAWIIFCLGAPLVRPDAPSLHWLYLVCGALCAIVVAALCKRRSERTGSLTALLFRATPAILLVSGVAIPVSAALGSQALMMLALIAGGVGAGALQVLWGEQFSRHTTAFAAYASPAAAIVTAVVVALSATQVNSVGYAVIPLLSFALLWFHGRRATAAGSQEQASEGQPVPSADGASPAARPSKRTAPLGIGKLMFSIMAFSLLCRMFDPISPVDGPFAFMGGSAVFSLVVVGIAFLLIVHTAGNRFNPTLIYRLSLPIMVAGYVAVSLFLDAHAALTVLIINVGYEFFDILTWVLFVDASRRRGENALYVFGLGVAFMFAGMALGNTLGPAVSMLVASGAVQMNVVAMVAVLCLVIVAFLVLPEGAVAQLSGSIRETRKEEKREKQEQEETSEPLSQGQGRLERQCELVARTYKLTPRESEVVVLLAYGRTLAIIARDLQIAKGTARTHIESIYRKLGVHKQQELIDLVESFSPADADQAPRG